MRRLTFVHTKLKSIFTFYKGTPYGEMETVGHFAISANSFLPMETGWVRKEMVLSQFPSGRPSVRNRVGSWQPAQIEWLSGPIDGMRIHPKLGSTRQIGQDSAARTPAMRDTLRLTLRLWPPGRGARYAWTIEAVGSSAGLGAVLISLVGFGGRKDLL